jgi:hypothetical protein
MISPHMFPGIKGDIQATAIIRIRDHAFAARTRATIALEKATGEWGPLVGDPHEFIMSLFDIERSINTTMRWCCADWDTQLVPEWHYYRDRLQQKS